MIVSGSGYVSPYLLQPMVGFSLPVPSLQSSHDLNLVVVVVFSDETMVKHLLALLPMVSDDPGARNALWSILERVSQHFLNTRPELPLLSKGASVMVMFANNSSSLMDDLDDHREDDEEEDEKRASLSVNADSTPSCGRQSKLSTVSSLLVEFSS